MSRSQADTIDQGWDRMRQATGLFVQLDHLELSALEIVPLSFTLLFKEGRA